MLDHIRYMLEGMLTMPFLVWHGKPAWGVENMPDLTGKVALVTGGNSGIGYETAKGLLVKNATVYIGVRSVIKGNEAAQKLKDATGNEKIHILQIDLADLFSVKKAVMEFQISGSKLHMLFNNAGVMLPAMDRFTVQGYDLQFGTNVLGPYLLTKLLLPILEATAASASPADPVRIIELSSSTHLLTMNTGPNIICYESLHGESKVRTRMGDLALYSQSKSANILVSKARARFLKNHNIVSLSVHPGHIESRLHRHNTGFRKFGIELLLYPGPYGAITPLYAGVAPETAHSNGKFFIPWAREQRPRSDHVDNIEAEDKLIAWLEKQLEGHNVL